MNPIQRLRFGATDRANRILRMRSLQCSGLVRDEDVTPIVWDASPNCDRRPRRRLRIFPIREPHRRDFSL